MSIVDERKIDQIVSELGRYKVIMAALQEKKQFESEAYMVGDSVVF